MRKATKKEVPVAQITDRRVSAFLMRLEGHTYAEIAFALGNFTNERARQLTLQGAKKIAVSGDPRAEEALEFVRRYDKSFNGDPLDVMDGHVRKLVAEKGGVEKLPDLTPLEMWRTKNCGRKRLSIITRLLRDRGLDWKFDEESKAWWAESSGLARDLPLK